MPCLVCEKRIPLLLQLSGSKFCSEEHRQQHADQQKSFSLARLSLPVHRPVSGPKLARFAFSLSSAGRIDCKRKMGEPIPGFQDLILCPQVHKAKYMMGLKGAKTITSIPWPSPPGAALAIGGSAPHSWVRLRLSPPALGALDVTRRLPAASLAVVSAQIPSHPIRARDSDFPSFLCESAAPPRGSIGRPTPPFLHGAPALVGNLYTGPAHACNREVGSRTPVSRPATHLTLHAPVSLPAATGLRPLQGPIPVWFDAVGQIPNPAPGLQNGCSFRIAPTEDSRTPAQAILGGSLATPYRGESFAPRDSTPGLPPWRCFVEPRSFPVSVGVFTLESAALAANADGSYFQEIASTAPHAIGAAGFALEGLDAPARSGFSGPLFLACDFPLCPVWLPALFDDVGGLHASLRRCANPQPVLQFLGACEELLPAADGPGFSGSLACPTPGAAYWDFRETWKPEEVSMPEHVTVSQTVSEPVVISAPEGRLESPWQRAVRFWRQAPALVQGLALLIMLAVCTLIYGPKIALQAQSPAVSSWKAAIQARATVDLRDDFHAGFTSWNGKPGWEKTWSIDGAGSAQPGRLALFNPTVPLTDYRFEFQGQILAKALGMALRAADPSNYQAVKIGVVKPGPLSSLTFARYPVIDGHEGPKTEMAIPLTVRSDTLYKLLVLVQGDHFTVTVNDVLADAWTDGRFKTGGIGFFADKGEVARVRTVHVIDKEDFLGWLCYQVSQWTADRPTIGEKHE